MSAGALPGSEAQGQRAFVVGATGYVGREVVAQWRRKEGEVVAHVRFDSPRAAEWRERFQALGAAADSTPWDPAAFAERFRELGITHLFLCLGTTARRALRKSTSSVPDNYRAVDLGLSSLLIGAAVASGLRPRVVLLSSARARAGSRNRYLSARGELEDLLIASGLPYTIARPAFITGRGRDEFRPLERLGAGLVDWALLWCAILGMQLLRERYRAIDGPELGRALVAHALDPRSAGKLLHAERLRDFP